MMTSLNEIHLSLDIVVNELLSLAGIDEPPVNAFHLAQHLGWEIVLNARQEERGRLKRIHDKPTIFLKPDDRPERVQWALAHELGESLSDRWSDWIEEEELTAGPASREALANLFATRLLLPECWFGNTVSQTGCDLFELKQSFSTASHHLIAQRLLDLADPLIVTIFDHGQRTSRRSNWLPSPPPVQSAELRCWQECHCHNKRHQDQADNLSLHGWPIHEPDWKREILLTRPLEMDDC
ncbi:hypothetical protein Pla110_12610 [Polystyrenella longa]|uniref:IrrE N-terminal-like domain-containing protein n=1 Tax=Polystyrenella longa TaxID=2528007 RepID=A0A518CK13_9PLAN|nr:ImmA/IrrE family metallo-endopeptidase [Polystyrenella longa]QDU79550.1 hypothetical protein Pla110_12610 [Polystyrenella longa]